MTKSEMFHNTFLRLLDVVPGCNSEKDLEDRFLKPFLEALGYPQGEGYQQQVGLGKKRVDFLISAQKCAPSRHFLVVEAKAPRQNLNIHTRQIEGYLRDSGSIFGLLTNGKRFSTNILLANSELYALQSIHHHPQSQRSFQPHHH